MQNVYDKNSHDIIALRKGRYANNCLFFSWNDAAVHITDYPQAKYKGFSMKDLPAAARYVRLISIASLKKCPGTGNAPSAVLMKQPVDVCVVRLRPSPKSTASKAKAKGIDTTSISRKRPRSDASPASTKISKKQNAAEKKKVPTPTKRLPVTKGWLANLDKLKEYKEKHGSFDISKSDEHNELRNWVSKQNDCYRTFRMKNEYTPMTEEKIKMLHDIGFSFKFDELKMLVGSEALKAYAKNSLSTGMDGDTSVAVAATPATATTVPISPSAASATAATAMSTKSPSASPKKPSNSDSNINSRPTKLWMNNFNKLKAYKEKHGFCTIRASKTKEHEDLRKWVKKQNTQYENLKSKKDSQMTQIKITMLQNIGFRFEWDHKKVESILEAAMEVEGGGEWEREKWEEIGTQTAALSDDSSASLSISKAASSSSSPSKVSAAAVAKHQAAVAGVSNATTNEASSPPTLLTCTSSAQKNRKYQPGEVWMAKFNTLKEYKEKHGSFDIGRSKEHKALRLWIRNQNDCYRVFKRKIKYSPMTEEKIKLLQDIGFRFNFCDETMEQKLAIADTKWDDMYQALKRHKETHGICTINKEKAVAANATEEIALFNWMVSQKMDYDKLVESKPSRLTAARMQKLNDLGFQFNRRKKVKWEDRMEQLREYKRDHGHLKIPMKHPVLGTFTAAMRVGYNKYVDGDKGRRVLTEEKLKDLTDIGFVFSVGRRKPLYERLKEKITWDERFENLIRFKDEHGHLNVKQNDPSGLGQWSHQVRKNYKLLKEGKKGGSLTTERVLRLSDIGFEFVRQTRAPRKTQGDTLFWV